MHPIVNIAVRAARSAGNIIVRYADRLDRVSVEEKGPNDYVSDVDRMAEQEIRGVLHKAYPDHAVIGEESGGTGDADCVWIIDPLDGTRNFLHGFPHWAVSIAMKHRGVLEVGVIYDPLRQELFTAKRGSGATLESRRIRVSPLRGIDGALLGTGFPFRQPEHHEAYLGMFGAVFMHVGDLRRAGSAALDLAYVACARLDGFWEVGLKEWDIAAGALLVQEAGGMITDFSGRDRYLENGNVVAGSPRLCQDLLRTITPHLSPALRV
ncbi:MAG: inositol monophosphatase [Nitrococcus sp.]|nr:inositol monophosphatase [Nitrococcus sp.]